MSRDVIRILKSNQVQVSGSVRLAPRGGAPVSQTDGRAEVAQQARIVESNNEYAIIEVVCGCGSKSHIQCNYAALAQAESAEDEGKEQE